MEIETYHDIAEFINCDFDSPQGAVTLLGVTIQPEPDGSHFCRCQQGDMITYISSKELELCG